MKAIICKPEVTMSELKDATVFYNECINILGEYVADVQYISTTIQVNQLIASEADKNDILVFFNSEKGKYSDLMLRLIKKYNDVNSRIWAIAMENTHLCRKPPAPVTDKQSFDVSCRKENRSPYNNNLRAIAHLFARKIVAQILSPLYRDEVLYFISHKRSDGEHITANLADALKILTRERNVYRDVVNVAVGDDAQKDINKNLKVSDVVIFLQTQEAQDSENITNELCYALVNDIPVLWIQIDKATYENMKIHPGTKPILSYESKDFDNPERLEEIVDEIEDNCFRLIMNSSNQVFSYINCLSEMNNAGKIKLLRDSSSTLAYELEYREKIRDRYDSGVRKHYIQFFGRNPQERDIQTFSNRIENGEQYKRNNQFFLLSNHGHYDSNIQNNIVIEENYDNYLMNLENILGLHKIQRDKRIILSGSFPDYDEIYNISLIEALVVYSREIIKNGYTLVFGSHPTFQHLIFEIADLYAQDRKNSIEMHMDRAYIDQYDLDNLKSKCKLKLADGLQEMRENMICKEPAELLICLGGKIKNKKAEQGVDIEVELAKNSEIPVALVGTVGGRSSEYAFEMLKENKWTELNSWDKSVNENLFYNVNHRLMIRRLLNLIEDK